MKNFSIMPVKRGALVTSLLYVLVSVFFFRAFLGKALLVFFILLFISASLALKNDRILKFMSKPNILIAYLVLFLLSHTIHIFSLEGLYLFRIIIYGLLWFLLVLCAYSFGLEMSGKDEAISRLLGFYLAMALINGVVNLYAWVTTTGGIVGRYNFISPIYQSLSGGIEITVFSIFILKNMKEAFFGKQKIHRILYYLFFSILLINIVILQVRKWQIAFLVFYSLSLLLGSRRRYPLWRYIVFLAFTFALLLGIYHFRNEAISLMTNYVIPMLKLKPYDFEIRIEPITAALIMLKEHPLFGIGYGNFPIFAGEYTVLASAHNGFFSVLAEWGLFGIVVTMCFYGLLLKKIHSLRNLKAVMPILIYLIIVMILSFLGNSAFLPPPIEIDYYSGTLMIWVFVGIVHGKYGSMNKTPDERALVSGISLANH